MLPRVVALGLVGLTLAACEKAPEPPSSSASAPAAAVNPFLEPSPLPYGLPPFDRITHAHFKPAFDQGMAEEQAEVAAMVADPAPPTLWPWRKPGPYWTGSRGCFMPSRAPIRTKRFAP